MCAYTGSPRPVTTNNNRHISHKRYYISITRAASFTIHIVISYRARKHEESFLTSSLRWWRWSLPLAFLLSPHNTSSQSLRSLVSIYLSLSIWSLLLPSFLPTNFQSAMQEFCLLPLVLLIALLYRQSFTKIGHLHSKKGHIYIFLFYF